MRCMVPSTHWRVAVDIAWRITIAFNVMAKSHTDGLLTPGQVADQWKVSVRTIQRYIADGKLRALKLPGGQYRIDPADAAQAIQAAS